MITIAAIDPGSSHLGLAIYTLDDERNITGIKAYTVNASEEYNGTYIKDTSSFSELIADDRIVFITKRILEILAEEDEIDIVVYEQPFINFSRPQSYVILMRQVNSMMHAIKKAHHRAILRTYSVQEVKKTFGKAGKLLKDDMLIGAKNNDDILNHFSKEELDEISEHAIDAMAVGLTHVYKMKSKEP